MVQRPAAAGAFEFVVLSTLRAAQLLRGCLPIIDPGDHRPTVIAQLEVAGGHVMNTFEGRTNGASATQPSNQSIADMLRPHIREE
jgi:DNA-directed RNA polymerase subunit K/omega